MSLSALYRFSPLSIEPLPSIEPRPGMDVQYQDLVGRPRQTITDMVEYAGLEPLRRAVEERSSG